jgi:ApbE superfamily uncharacterized protein (UPF0280 family)
MKAQSATLPDGRVHFRHGPIDIILQVDATASILSERAVRIAWQRFQNVLEELCSELPLLRSPETAKWARLQGPIAKRMTVAVSSLDTFITPMAAVAGAVADELRDLMCKETQICRAIVNNGGDVSLYLAPGQECRIGLVSIPEAGLSGSTLRISADDEIQGVATSGWRGRSHSLGIADAVTVAAADCATADAAATIIANTIDLPGHPSVRRSPASELSPDSDLGELLVTVDVSPLSAADAKMALSRGWSFATELVARGAIHSAAMSLCGESMVADHLGQGRTFRHLADQSLRIPRI